MQNISKVEGGIHGLSQRFGSVACVGVVPDEQEERSPETSQSKGTLQSS